MTKVKAVLIFFMASHMAVDKAKANDGKIDLGDLGLLLDPIMKLPDAIEGAKGALDELRAADDAAVAELKVWAKANYDIVDDELEVKVEKGLSALVEVASFVSSLVTSDPA